MHRLPAPTLLVLSLATAIAGILAMVLIVRMLTNVPMKQITVIVMALAQTLMVPSHVLVILDTVEMEFPVSTMMNAF